MSEATQIVIVNLKADAAIGDSSAEAGRIWQDLLKTVSSQAGYKQSYWGTRIESPSALIWLIDWDTSAQGSGRDSYVEDLLRTRAAAILDFSAASSTYHVKFFSSPPQPPKVGPVTEFVTFFLPLNIDEKEFETNAKECIDVFARTKGGPNAVTGGWAEEEKLDNPSNPGTEARGFTFLAAWDSVDHHEQFKSSKVFGEALAPLREYVIGRWFGHTKFVLQN